MNLESSVFFSIKPEFVDLIVSGKKNHEFRKYIPSKNVKEIIVYTSYPKAEIKYVLEIENIIQYPDIIDEYGEGNKDFNEGKKKSRYAYKIGAIYELDSEISLSKLKKAFSFTPPQRFCYGDTYPELLQFIANGKKRRII